MSQTQPQLLDEEERQIQSRMRDGLNKLDKQNDQLRNGLSMLIEADERANTIAENLDSQGKKIKKSSGKLDEVSDNMRESKKTLNVMSMSFWDPRYWFLKR